MQRFQFLTRYPVRRLRQSLLRGAAALILLVSASVAGAQAAAGYDEDPPGRVGKISLLDGNATLTDLRDGSEEAADLNWPITSGMRLATGEPARAEVRIGSTALRLDADTVVDFVRIDDSYMQIAVLQGSATIRLRNPDLLNEIEIVTQRERIVFDDVGRYRIDVDVTPGVTSISAFSGRARVVNAESSFAIGSNQRGELTAPPASRFRLVAAYPDRFDGWVAHRDRRDDELVAARYVSREMTGIESLDQYGHWRSVEGYGSVWFPHSVDAGWAPYRYGRWAYVAPWGWTWIDEAPWGFAPFHYGRWAFVGGTWGWIPGGYVARPVYAPALVAWYGTPGVSISVGIGDSIGWFPLGPGEIYMPHYRHSPRHRERINIHHVHSGHRVTQVREPSYVYREPRFSTWVPRDRFHAEPVHRVRRNPPSEWRRFIGSPNPPENIPGTKRRQAEGGHRSVHAPSAMPDGTARPALQPQPPLPPPARSPAVREWSTNPTVRTPLPAERPNDRSGRREERHERPRDDRPQPNRGGAGPDERRFNQRSPAPHPMPAAPAVQPAPAVQAAPAARAAPIQQSAPPAPAPQPPSANERSSRGGPPEHAQRGRDERGGPPEHARPQWRARER